MELNRELIKKENEEKAMMQKEKEERLRRENFKKAKYEEEMKKHKEAEREEKLRQEDEEHSFSSSPQNEFLLIQAYDFRLLLDVDGICLIFLVFSPCSLLVLFQVPPISFATFQRFY